MEQVKININNSAYQTAIVILNWNGLADTMECLESIQQYCIAENFFIVLVDNNSSEAIDPLIERKWAIPVLILKNHENSGFAEGNNIGVRLAMAYKPEYILLLNNDTVLLDNVLAKMTGMLQKYPDVGVVGAVNYYFSNPEEVWQAGAHVSVKTGAIKLAEVDPTQEITKVEYVPGSSIMFRAFLADKVGLLDPNFFAYSEELDFCLRVKKENYGVVFIPDAKILHKVGKSSPMAAKEYLRLRNKFYLFKRHSTPSDFIKISIKETAKAFAKAGIQLVKKGTFVYYTAIYDAIVDYKHGRFGKGKFEKFLRLK
ncbi:MAG: hypothetical protein JWQ57_1864 [Mucilaginibacter sp.]|nr:hypothetical protein [Mucilaginibacter sp.]